MTAEGETEEWGMPIQVDINIGLREWEANYGRISESGDWDNAEGEEAEDWDAAGLTAYIILWVALLVCLTAIPCAILAGLHKMTKIPGMVLGYVGGGLMILAAVLYLAISPKKAYGVEDIGFGWTFYVVVVGGGVQTVAGDLVRGIRGRSRAPMRQVSPAPGWGAPERSPRRDGYYGERRGTDYPPRRRDEYYDDRRRRDHPPRRRDDYYHDRRGTDDLSILKKRLARGEITKREYEDLKRVIEE